MRENDMTVNSLLGNGSVFKGDIKVNGIIKLAGDFSGTIESTGQVFISESARVESSIKATSVVIGGMVKGDITATDKVTVLSTGIVMGSITTSRLIAEDGVVLDGVCRVVDPVAGDSGKWRGALFHEPGLRICSPLRL